MTRSATLPATSCSWRPLVASRVEVREVDTVARIAGDEFIVLCEQINGVHDATNICDRLIEALQAPVQIGDEEVHVGASVGIALCTDGAESADSIVSNADLAMYRAKQNGRGRYELFDETMQLWITTRLALEHDLQRAIERDELRLVYQPVVVSDTGEIRGFEALIRWERPGFGLVGPNEFIPVAEETGLIVDIGAWVLEEACRRAVEWNRRWPDRRLGVSVNVSGRQLLAPDFLERVVTILGRTAVNPALVTFELTESTLIDDPLTAEALLRGLRALGCNLALDDFGTGYSSLTYLKTFPINFVKIDKSFVSTIGSEREGAAIVAAVISLAETLGLSVVAEGVEELDQRVRLEELGCPYMQGYYFALSAASCRPGRAH